MKIHGCIFLSFLNFFKLVLLSKTNGNMEVIVQSFSISYSKIPKKLIIWLVISIYKQYMHTHTAMCVCVCVFTISIEVIGKRVEMVRIRRGRLQHGRLGRRVQHFHWRQWERKPVIIWCHFLDPSSSTFYHLIKSLKTDVQIIPLRFLFKKIILNQTSGLKTITIGFISVDKHSSAYKLENLSSWNTSNIFTSFIPHRWL